MRNGIGQAPLSSCTQRLKSSSASLVKFATARRPSEVQRRLSSAPNCNPGLDLAGSADDAPHLAAAGGEDERARRSTSRCRSASRSRSRRGWRSPGRAATRGRSRPVRPRRWRWRGPSSRPGARSCGVVTNPPPGERRHGVQPGVVGGHDAAAPLHGPVAARPPSPRSNSTDSRPPCCTTRSWSAPSSRAGQVDAVRAERGRERPWTGRIPPSRAWPIRHRRPGTAPAARPVSSTSSARAPGTWPSMPPYSLTRTASSPGRATKVFGVGEGADGPRRPFRLAGRHRLRLGGVRRGCKRAPGRRRVLSVQCP